MGYSQNHLFGSNRHVAAVAFAVAMANAALAQVPSQHHRIKPVPREPEYTATTRIPDDPHQNMLLPSVAGEYGDPRSEPAQPSTEHVVAEKRRLPDGYVVANRSARMVRDQDWYVARLAPVQGLPDAPPLRVLPNSKLGLLETVLADTGRQPDFLVTGRVTDFNGANYLLIESLTEGTPGRSKPLDRAAQGGSTAKRSEREATGGTPPTPAPATSTTPSREPTAEEVVKQLMQNRPRRALVLPPQMPFANPTTEPSELALTTNRAAKDAGRWTEDTSLADRPGRLVPGDVWWTFAFEDMSRLPQERPVRLLPNQLLETAISLSGGGTKGVVLIISGDVTVHKGVDYLLLRKVLIRRDLGNFR